MPANQLDCIVLKVSYIIIQCDMQKLHVHGCAIALSHLSHSHHVLHLYANVLAHLEMMYA